MCQEFQYYPPSFLTASPSQDKHAKQFLSADSIPTSWPNFSLQVSQDPGILDQDSPNHFLLLMGVVKPRGQSEKRVVEFEAHSGATSVHSILHPDL